MTAVHRLGRMSEYRWSLCSGLVWRDDDGMGGRRWARAVLAAVAALLLIALGLAGNRLGWWSAPDKPGEAAGGSLEWLEPVSWIAGLLSFVVALYYARGQDAAVPPVAPQRVTLVVVQSTDAAVTASAGRVRVCSPCQRMRPRRPTASV
jgi:hypothetical protein